MSEDGEQQRTKLADKGVDHDQSQWDVRSLVQSGACVSSPRRSVLPIRLVRVLAVGLQQEL